MIPEHFEIAVGSSSVQVTNAGVGVKNGKSHFPDSANQICIFQIKKKPFIEAVDGLEEVGPDQCKASRQIGNEPRFGEIQVAAFKAGPAR